ncbi:MAG: phosphatidylserine decarboxylase, partial [Myxococcota bacterium]|nr:phosphatidylserine decarboxylase [Myxococcota bacterium]
MSAVTYATAQILRALPRERIGRVLGRLADRPWSAGLGRAVVGLYSRLYDVRFDDCVERGGWASFDAFFTRRLR